ncbi:hypothetical protein DY000_02061792 [Brassica cretica]|uniref:Protein kinase domain-containing protein n=1 Tax=Brassica cretica TaxID=69181 RepID=A0ABQ7ANH1_BRACR|nr:hypothetical protein DY000_02061792 [Brassica cretica]
MSMKCDLKICGFGLARAPLETHAVTENVVLGCIFLERYWHTALPWKRSCSSASSDYGVEIGSPTEEDIGSLNETIDLMEKMLKFDPRRRITVDDALAHPYLINLHDITNEPVCMKPFEVSEGVLIFGTIIQILSYVHPLKHRREDACDGKAASELGGGSLRVGSLVDSGGRGARQL